MYPVDTTKNLFQGNKLIWAGKTPRIKINLLFCSKGEGGLNLPNMELYQITAQMFYIDQIINNTNEDPWLVIENHQLQPNHLLSILFSKKKVILLSTVH